MKFNFSKEIIITMKDKIKLLVFIKLVKWFLMSFPQY